jgi:hypothetical protein
MTDRPSSLRRHIAVVALTVAVTLASACATGIQAPRRAPRPPAIDRVSEIIIADSIGAITASVGEADTIERLLTSWAFSSDDWRAPWLPGAAPMYWIEFHAEPGQELPPRVYGLGRAGSQWWLSVSGEQGIEWMKALPGAEADALIYDLELPDPNADALP